MWLFTQHGFYSIVADRTRSGRHLLRARVRHDLENLIELAALEATILHTPSADYIYRISIDAADLVRVMHVLATTVDYPNFKGRIAKLDDQAARSANYHHIWAEAARIPDSSAH